MMFPLRFVIQLPNFPVRFFFFLYTSNKIHKHIDLLPGKVNLLCNNKRAITMTYKLREINYITNYLKYYLLSIHFSYVDRSNRTITFLYCRRRRSTTIVASEIAGIGMKSEEWDDAHCKLYVQYLDHKSASSYCKLLYSFVPVNDGQIEQVVGSFEEALGNLLKLCIFILSRVSRSSGSASRFLTNSNCF